MDCEELLDVMREHGWSETGQDYDPVRWLRYRLSDGLSPEAADELRWEVDHYKNDRDEARSELDDLRTKSATAQPAVAS